jgi:hypothetical protein
MKFNNFKKILLILLSFISVFFCYSRDVFAVSDSTRYMSTTQPGGGSTSQMVFSNINATIIIEVAWSDIWTGCNAGGCCSPVGWVAQCPIGTMPDSSNDIISAEDLYNCLQNNAFCKPTITKHGGSYASTICGKTFQRVWRFSTKIKCNLSLQGWFPVSFVNPIISNQQPGFSQDFNLGVYTVTYNDQGIWNVESTCGVAKSPVTAPSTIPGYGYSAFCPYSYYLTWITLP